MAPIPPNRDRDDVIRAVAKLLGCSYLDVVPTPAENDHMREVAANARAAMDRLVATAARWRKVAPLIERLRPEVEGRDVYRSPYGLIDAVHFLLHAATQEPTP